MAQQLPMSIVQGRKSYADSPYTRKAAFCQKKFNQKK